MNQSVSKPSRERRLAAVAAIVLVAFVVVTTAGRIVVDLGRLFGALPLLVVALAAAWFAITRTGGRRKVAVVVLLAAVVGLVVGPLVDNARDVVLVLVRVVALVLAYALARHAVGRSVRALTTGATAGRPVGPAARGVLIMNLKSGGGKAERFGLVEACRARGIDPIVLQPGDDLSSLAGDAIDGGADVIGMAGGDGSQALVSAVAADRGVPMVVVPAGTRNHLALDLGLDRDDVVGALDAFGDAVERTMDLAEVNGRVFVNNVSLGLYATIVRSPEYRDAKVDTTLSMLPKLLGPGSHPFDLHFRGPDGVPQESAHLIQISNNPYKKGSGSRPQLDTGRLGVFTLELADDQAVASLLAALAAGRPERFAGFASWTTEAIEVGSGGPIDVGLDGEAMSLDPPLRFSIRPAALRVRLPTHAIGLSPAGRSPNGLRAAGDVWRVACGRPVAAAVAAPEAASGGWPGPE